MTAKYDAKDFAGLMEVYEGKVSPIANDWLRLNLDALLDIFMKEAPTDIQRRALDYAKRALGAAVPAAINKYSDLVANLTKYVDGK